MKNNIISPTQSVATKSEQGPLLWQIVSKEKYNRLIEMETMDAFLNLKRFHNGYRDQ
jgi:hypothetical protein